MRWLLIFSKSVYRPTWFRSVFQDLIYVRRLAHKLKKQ